MWQRGNRGRADPGPRRRSLAASGLPRSLFAFLRIRSSSRGRAEKRLLSPTRRDGRMPLGSDEPASEILASGSPTPGCVRRRRRDGRREMVRSRTRRSQRHGVEVIDCRAPGRRIRGRSTIVIAERAAAERDEVDPAVIAEEFQRLRIPANAADRRDETTRGTLRIEEERALPAAGGMSGAGLPRPFQQQLPAGDARCRRALRACTFTARPAPAPLRRPLPAVRRARGPSRRASAERRVGRNRFRETG